MKITSFDKIITNMEDFCAETGFQLELTYGNSVSIITELTGNIEYYFDDVEGVRLETYDYFSNALLTVITQSALRKEYVSDRLNISNAKTISSVKKLSNNYMNIPEE